MDLDGLRSERLTTTRPLDLPMPWVDPHDIATVATLRLLADDWTGRQVQAVQERLLAPCRRGGRLISGGRWTLDVCWLS